MNIADIPLVDRLLATRDSIHTHGPEHFDMRYWLHTPYEISNQFFKDIDQINISDCGTTACLAGHAALAAQAHGVELADDIEAAQWLGLHVGDDYGDGREFFHVYHWADRGVNDEDPAEIHAAVLDWLDELIRDAKAVTA